VHEKIGENIGPWVIFEQLPYLLGPGEHVIAVKSLESSNLETVANSVEGPISATVGISKNHPKAVTL
jgi:hypothetical protein